MGAIILGGLAGYGAVHLIFNATAVHLAIQRDLKEVEEEFGSLGLVKLHLMPTLIFIVGYFFGYSLILTYRGAMQGGFMIYPEVDDEE